MDANGLRDIFTEFFRKNGRRSLAFGGEHDSVALAFPADGVCIWFDGCPRTDRCRLIIEASGNDAVIRSALLHVDEWAREIGTWQKTNTAYRDGGVFMVATFGPVSRIGLPAFFALLESVLDFGTELRFDG